MNGVFVLVYTPTMLAAWKLLSRRYLPEIGLGLAACAIFIYSLGSTMAYGLILIVVLTLWVRGQRGGRNAELLRCKSLFKKLEW